MYLPVSHIHSGYVDYAYQNIANNRKNTPLLIEDA
jgi:hypothetical protein